MNRLYRLFLYSLLISFYTQNIFASERQTSLNELHDLAKKNTSTFIERFDSAKKNKQVREALSLLNEMLRLELPPSSRDLFSMCRSLRKVDCTLFKARIFEDEGNAGSAMDLYTRSGNSKDYLRLKALSGQSIEKDISEKGQKLSAIEKTYYSNISDFAKGEWNKVAIQESAPLFMRFYSYLMLGNIDKAKGVLQDASRTNSFTGLLEYKRMKALMSYAENKQYEALTVFKEVLKYDPSDRVSLRFIAHIYYRTGWYDRAEKIYAELISSEWRDTELYYLLSERAEMRVRNLKITSATKDAEKIFKEYPDRYDFIVQWTGWLTEYGKKDLAEKYITRIPVDKGPYFESLRYYVQGIMFENNFDLANAVVYFDKAYSVYKAVEYKDRADIIREAEKIRERGKKLSSIDCREYSFVPTDIGWIMALRPVKYYFKKEDNTFRLILKLKLIHDKELNIGNTAAEWSRSISSTWSKDGLKVQLAIVDEVDSGTISIEVQPWPSSLYLKRVSSHQWSLLTPYSVIDHEAGHLLGLSDEYFEPNKNLSSKNIGRFMGEPDSIMRNMLYGVPQKRHIQFILSSLKCFK
jgi:tetratricopeptide (TPR) repeat protein